VLTVSRITSPGLLRFGYEFLDQYWGAPYITDLSVPVRPARICPRQLRTSLAAGCLAVDCRHADSARRSRITFGLPPLPAVLQLVLRRAGQRSSVPIGFEY